MNPKPIPAEQRPSKDALLYLIYQKASEDFESRIGSQDPVPIGSYDSLKTRLSKHKKQVQELFGLNKDHYNQFLKTGLKDYLEIFSTLNLMELQDGSYNVVQDYLGYLETRGFLTPYESKEKGAKELSRKLFN